MDITTLDHLVLTVRDIDTTLEFYSRILGMQVIEFGEGRKALKFGQQKINLHQAGNEFEPRARHPLPGSADLCFITTTDLSEVLDELEQQSIPVEQGPVNRTGANGPLQSIYIRDPDGNLIELANQI